jgi:hypothetical protein
MKNLIWSTVLILFAAIASFATPITVTSASIPNWQYGGTTARVRIFSNQKFITSDSQLIMQSLPTSNAWYKEINCTVSSNTLTIPQTVLDSTTDSSNPAATYIAYIYDYNNVRRDTWISNFRVPTSAGTTVSWAQILLYNQNAANPPPPGYYTNDQVNVLIAAAIASGGSLSSTSSRIEKDQSLYSNSLASAVATLCPGGTCSTPTLLNITRPLTVGANLTVPKGLTINFTGEGKLTLSAGVTLTITNFLDPGSRQVFDSSASGAKVLFAKAAVDELKIAWWTGTGTNINVTDALNEALETANAYQTPIHFSQGVYLTSGDHLIDEGVNIRGEGNHLIDNLGTVLKLSSPTADAIFKIGEINYSVRFENIIFSGVGTTGKYGVLFQGSYPNSSGDTFFHKVTFQNFEIGLFYDDVIGVGNSWQMAQVQINQCVFFHNNIGVKTESLNSAFTFISTNFYTQNNQTALYFQGVGITTITGCEFAGPGAGAVNAKAIVIAGAHVNINIISNQDEGNNTFLENNVSDITGIVNLYGNLIQSQLYINFSMVLNSVGNNYPPDAIRVTAPATPHIFSENDNIRTDIGTLEAPGVIPANPLRLVKGNDPITQKEFNPILGTSDYRRGAFTVRQYSRFVMPKYLQGSPNNPVVGIFATPDNGESKRLLRLGIGDSTNTVNDLFYYDFWRQNSGDEAGRLQIEGNQSGYVGYDLKGGDLTVQGSIRAQACNYAYAATVTIDARCGNHFFITLTGNLTLQIAAFNTTDQTKADGQRITFELTQDGAGSRTCALAGSNFVFGSDIPSITCSTAAGKTDLLTVQYSKRLNKWVVADFKKGF